MFSNFISKFISNGNKYIFPGKPSKAPRPLIKISYPKVPHSVCHGVSGRDFRSRVFPKRAVRNPEALADDKPLQVTPDLKHTVVLELLRVLIQQLRDLPRDEDTPP